MKIAALAHASRLDEAHEALQHMLMLESNKLDLDNAAA